MTRRKKTRRFAYDLLESYPYRVLHILSHISLICVCGQQEPEIEYVEGYDELEEEENIEDFGGFEMDESFKSNHHGKDVLSFKSDHYGKDVLDPCLQFVQIFY